MRTFIDTLTALPSLPLLRTDYRPRGFWFRLGVDLFLSNIGLLLAILTTVVYWTLTRNVVYQDWFRLIIVKGWLVNAPWLTVACLLGYTLGGLYRGSHELDHADRARMVVKAVCLAFLIFFALIYLSDTFVPRRTIGVRKSCAASHGPPGRRSPAANGRAARGGKLSNASQATKTIRAIRS